MAFADISKTHNDFFSENFHSGWSGELVSTGTTKNSLTVTAKKDGPTTTATFKPKWTLSKYNTEIKAAVDTAGNSKIELINSDKLVDGLKLTGTADAGKKEVGASVEFNKDKINFKTSVASPWSKERKVDANISLLYSHNDHWSVGGAVDLQLADRAKLTSTAVGFRHTTAHVTASLVASKRGDSENVTGGFVHHLSSTEGDLAAKFNYDVGTREAIVAVGLSRVCKEHTWKTKISSTGRAGVSHSHNWNAKTRVTTSVDFDALNPSDHRFGVHVKFSQ